MDDYSPRCVGDLSHPLAHTFVDGAGNPHALTGVVTANMTFVLVSVQSGTRKVGLGTWTITDAPNGIAVYHWNTADVNSRIVANPGKCAFCGRNFTLRYQRVGLLT